VPYRIDVRSAAGDRQGLASAEPLPQMRCFDRLVEIGAIDVDVTDAGGLAALMPDSVSRELVAGVLGHERFTVSPATGRDADSVWVLSPRPVQAGRIRIVPAAGDPEPGTLRLLDTPAFGTGLHPTTMMCLEWLDETLASDRPHSVLDVGIGSGVLALAALALGVPRATGLDIDDDALRVAAENARLNRLVERLHLTRGGPDAVSGTWPLVLANVLAAPLIEMAPTLVRRVGHHGQLVLSGIPASVEHDVSVAYERCGLRLVHATSRAGWVALILRPTW
jgi:ribosomal protein L11 methyltransferase